MVIGDGDLASVLPRKRNLVFFASGVSDSQCTDEREYDREMRLLMRQDERKHLVYFSSLATLFSNTRYMQHKRHMETLVKERFLTWTIVRIGNITWGKNPHTLINYLRAHPEAEVKDEYRYIVDQDEFLYWIGLIPDFSVEMNIPGRRLKVQEVVNEYVTNHS